MVGHEKRKIHAVISLEFTTEGKLRTPEPALSLLFLVLQALGMQLIPTVSLHGLSPQNQG